MTTTLDLTIPAPTPAQARLRQFIIYDDFNAGVAARWLGCEITAQASRHGIMTSEMWKLDMATRFGMFREMTLQAAGEADVLLVAASDVSAPEPAFAQWLTALMPWRANRAHRGLLLALLDATISDLEHANEMAAVLAAFAQKADLEFAWQPMSVREVCDSAWIQRPLDALLANR